MSQSTQEKMPKTEADIKEEPASPGQKKTVKIILIVVGILVLLSILGVLVFGWLGAKIGRSIIDEVTDGRVNVSDDSISIQGENDDSFELRTEQELARDFPSEVPLYEPAELIGSARTSQGSDTAWSANFQSDDSQTVIYTYFEDAFSQSGWSIQSSFESGEMSTLGAENQNAGLQAQINVIADNDTTLISINVFQANE